MQTTTATDLVHALYLLEKTERPGAQHRVVDGNKITKTTDVYFGPSLAGTLT